MTSKRLIEQLQSVKLTSTQRQVVNQIALRSDCKGFSCIRASVLSKALFLSVDVVRYHLRNLKKKGVIATIERFASDGGRLAKGTQLANGIKIVFSWDGETAANALLALKSRGPCGQKPDEPEAKKEPDEEELQRSIGEARMAANSIGGGMQNSPPVYVQGDIFNTPKRSLKRSKKVLAPDEAQLEQMRQEWNERLVPIGYPRFVRVTQKFRKKLKTRIKAGFDWDEILNILEADEVKSFHVQASKHPRNWITPHWLVERDSAWERVASGHYHQIGIQEDEALPQPFRISVREYTK